MKWTAIVLLGLLTATFSFAQDVQYNFDQDADFTRFKTYRWEKHPESLDVDRLTLKQLGEAFSAELAKKGLTEQTEQTTGEADLVIVYQLAVRQEKEITSFNTGWGYGPGWRRGWYGGGGGMTTSTTSTISIGSVNLDMFDAANRQLVWRGLVSKAIDARAKPDKQQKNMRKAAEKLLKNYPPKKKK